MMLSVLAIVTLTVTTAAQDYVTPPFSKEAFAADYPFCAPQNSIPSSVINAGTEVTFTRGPEDVNNVATLMPRELPETEEGAHPICGIEHGIVLDDFGGVACTILYFRFVVDNISDDYKKIHFVIMFLYDSAYTPTELEIPVYGIPATTSPSLEEWATNENVGLFTGLDYGELENILKKRPTVFDFQWLNNLVSKHGIFLKETGSPLRTYVTRPVVLPNDTINKLIDTIIEIEVENYIHDYMEE